MEIFVGIKKNLRRKGILIYDHPHAKSINIAQCLLISVILVGYIISAAWYIFFEAETFSEQVDAIFPVIPGIFAYSMYLDSLRQRKQLMDLMLEFQTIIGNRK